MYVCVRAVFFCRTTLIAKFQLQNCESHWLLQIDEDMEISFIHLFFSCLLLKFFFFKLFAINNFVFDLVWDEFGFCFFFLFWFVCFNNSNFNLVPFLYVSNWIQISSKYYKLSSDVVFFKISRCDFRSILFDLHWWIVIGNKQKAIFLFFGYDSILKLGWKEYKTDEKKWKQL